MGSPTISHLILNTANYETMKQWYLDVLEAKVGYETSAHSACFLQTDAYHHRIGLFNVVKADDSAAATAPGSGDPRTLSRLNHFAFGHQTLGDLLDAYARLAATSTLPSRCVIQGPTVSISYEDPDHNIIELLWDKDYSEEQIAEYYAGGDRNVLGAIPFDPAQLLDEYRRGKTVAELTAWSPRAS